MADYDPLTDLTIKLSRQALSDEKKYREICNCVRRVIGDANRVSLWQFNERRDEIYCLCLLEDGSFSADIDLVLAQTTCADYFEAILRKEVVIAPVAREHPHTYCFTEDYFEPNNIYSLLDYIFHQDFKPIGIICCEGTTGPVSWTERDISMLKRIANITSMFF
ncbi:GAF domain-containing protein [Alteromonas ponticola]|uniref:GAF domain-containing protein n=1 Tax=Alteromonas ponticola TaxID=2720613 RepID=A0ABX1R1Z4_9ALTE|nr:GAF domain-containing protein [Alteromonas ponticola]NMH59092.1 GAF domain-containing protein [Alteromonas ponticola]